jgi:predicted O-methyltransferase YrrM
MFGLKTKIFSLLQKKPSKKIANESRIFELMKHFQEDEYGHEANIKTADLGYGWVHYGLIRQLRPKRVLCIGSRHGYIPGVLAQACYDNNQGRVDFIDAGFGLDDKQNWTGEGFWRTKKGKQTFQKIGLDNFISLHVTTTKKFAKDYPDVFYDYIYIDGDHSYQGVKFDYDTYWSKLRKGGYMVFHDVCVKGTKPEGEYGVWKLWNKLEKKNNIIKITYTESGLGIIQK